MSNVVMITDYEINIHVYKTYICLHCIICVNPYNLGLKWLSQQLQINNQNTNKKM